MEVNKKIVLDISRVVDYVKDRGFFAGFKRYSVENYDLEHALEVVEAIGKARTPHFVIDEENRFAYENFIKWCHCDRTMKSIDPLTGNIIQGDLMRGIYIAGNTGSGKSWCLEIMLAYATVWNFKISFYEDRGTARNFFWKNDRADEVCQAYMEKGDIQSFKKMPIIGIQDLGQEPQETLYMGNRLNVMQQLLEYRGDKPDALTLITSNLRISSEILQARYGDRVQSRLFEMCNYFEMKGKDRRLGI